MFDPKSYCKACDRLNLDEEKIKEMIAMTENQKKPAYRPVRAALVAAALAAALGITASAAELPAVKEFFATIFVTVSGDVGDTGLRLPDVAVEKREGRFILILDGEETDVTDALARDGKYLYEGDGFEVAVDGNGVATVTSYGDDGMSITYSTEGKPGQEGAVYKVTADEDAGSLQNYRIITDVEGAEIPTQVGEVSTYEITAEEGGAINVKSVDTK